MVQTELNSKRKKKRKKKSKKEISVENYKRQRNNNPTSQTH